MLDDHAILVPLRIQLLSFLIDIYLLENPYNLSLTTHS